MKRFKTLLCLLLAVVLMLLPLQSIAATYLATGDVNGDGRINIGDVAKIFSHARRKNLITDANTLKRADTNGDGKINIGDAALVFSWVRKGISKRTPVTLTVWTPSEDQYHDCWLVQMQEQFQKENPQYEITWINAICNEGDAGGFVSADPEAAADVYMFANDQLGTLVNSGALMPLEGKYLEQVLTDVSETHVNTMTYTDGNVYGFPMTNNTWFMYYNKNVFTEEDVKSLDTMLKKGRVAFPWSIAWYGGAFFLANGGEILGSKGNDASAGIQFGEENGGYEAALKMIQLAENPNMVHDCNGSGSAGLRTGQVDAYFSGSWDASYLSEALGDKLGAAQPPMVEIDGQQKQMLSFAGSKAVGVNPHTDHPEAAMEFASFLACVEAQKARYEMRGVIPAATVLAEDASIQENVTAVAEINTMANASVVQPSLPEMSYYWTPIGDFGTSIVNGSTNESNYMEMVDLLMERLNENIVIVPDDPDQPDIPEGSDELLPPPAGGEPITLKVWTSSLDQKSYGNWLVRMENSFQSAHPEYSITWVNEVCHEGDAGTLVSTDPEAAADVYMFANDQVGTLTYCGALEPLGGSYLQQVREDNSTTVVNTVTDTDGYVRGFPMANNTWFMYYNKNVFTKDDVKSLDTMLTKGTVCFPWGLGWYSGTFFMANGGELFGPQGNNAAAGIQFGKANGGYEAALKMIQLACNSNMKDDANFNGVNALANGDVDACFSGSWDAWVLSNDNIGVVQLPTVEIDGSQKQMKAFAGSKAVGVNSHSKNKKVALDFAAFLASEEGQLLRYQLTNTIPCAKNLADHPLISSDPIAVAEINTMTYAAIVQPSLPEMAYYWSPIADFSAGVYNGEVNKSNYQQMVDVLMDRLNKGY